MVVQRLQSVAGLQSKLLSCKKQAEALEKVARSERSTRFEQVETVLRLPETYRLWCLEVYHRNCFFDSLLAQVVLHLHHPHHLHHAYHPHLHHPHLNDARLALPSSPVSLARVLPRAPSSR
jgi:hypothetical protein